MRFFLITFAIVQLAASAPAQTPVRHRMPRLPEGASRAEQGQLVATAGRLARGDFAGAASQSRALGVPATVKVYVDWTPVRPGDRPAWKNSVGRALRGWNAAIGHSQFTLSDREDGANVLILFEEQVITSADSPPPSARTPAAVGIPRAGISLERESTAAECADTQVEPGGLGRTGRIRISLRQPGSTAPHSVASIGFLASRELGVFLGLGRNETAGDAMGPDPHGGTADGPSAKELRILTALAGARLQLLNLASSHTRIGEPRAVVSVDRTSEDAGDVWRGEAAYFAFLVRNVGDMPLEIDAHPSCSCTIPAYDKVIAPGGETRLTADLLTTGMTGRIEKQILLNSNDTERPTLALNLTANVRPPVLISPAEAASIVLKDGEPTMRDFDVVFQGSDPVKISQFFTSTSAASIAVRPSEDRNLTGRAYRVSVTVSPDAPLGRSTVSVALITTSRRAPQVDLVLTCEKGIFATPASLFFGAIGPDAKLPITQIVTLSKRGGQFSVRKVTSNDPRLTVTTEPGPSGSQRVTVIYAGGWTFGTIQDRIGVETDDPRQPTIEIPVIATVLPGSKPP